MEVWFIYYTTFKQIAHLKFFGVPEITDKYFYNETGSRAYLYDQHWTNIFTTKREAVLILYDQHWTNIFTTKREAVLILYDQHWTNIFTTKREAVLILYDQHWTNIFTTKREAVLILYDQHWTNSITFQDNFPRTLRFLEEQIQYLFQHQNQLARWIVLLETQSH
ncbi:hypothetical protein RhiirA4_455263 [Rhizophagus irregularis]|uniref:Uncharacterized protein n=1 Tax=Rhizophagus irregularis TaxID=588596 RepID=A0A2I1G4T3_9GLOM|nr:hypothetical protein RhiirA4_455263 [Rhizophagus irregularis]